jgi:drug/metabolite transporter (DMT)-like permease
MEGVMFLLSCAVLCGAVILLFLTLLHYRNPKQTFLKRHESMEVCLSLLLTGLFTFGFIGLFLNPVSMIDLIGAAVMVAATVFFFKVLKVKDRLAAFAADQESKRVITGDFQSTAPVNKPEPSYRKAA